MTIRTRLALWYSGLLTLLIIIFSIAVITVSRVTLLQTVDQVLMSAAANIWQSTDVVPVAEFGPPDRFEVYFRSEDVFHAPGISVQVWRTHVQDTPITPELIRSSDDIAFLERPLDDALIGASEERVNSSLLDGVPQRVMAMPLTAPDGSPLGQIMVSSPLQAIANANDQLLVITLISAAISIAVSIVLGMWLSKHLLKPIHAISEAATRVARTDDLSTRLEWTGARDELGELTELFNHMMARLQALFGVQQRFIADVSHELRTPLTSIIGHMEIMDRYGVDQESLDAVQREAERMSRMVNDLLLLTRADSGEMQVDFYPFDLDAIALDVYEQSLLLAKSRDLRISLDRIEPVSMNGSADRIRQLLLNLVNNAIKFTPDGGQIGMAVYTDGTDAILEVRDTGIGIAKDDCQRIFDRFFQADSARFHRNESDGAGLGLSIARWIVNIHDGTIAVESELNKGTTFTVRLPREGKPRPHENNGKERAPVRIKTQAMESYPGS